MYSYSIYCTLHKHVVIKTVNPFKFTMHLHIAEHSVIHNSIKYLFLDILHWKILIFWHVSLGLHNLLAMGKKKKTM